MYRIPALRSPSSDDILIIMMQNKCDRIRNKGISAWPLRAEVKIIVHVVSWIATCWNHTYLCLQ